MVAIHYTGRGAAVHEGGVSRALTQAALVALDAPAVGDVQPWRWRIDGDRAELYADRLQRLPGDPDGRLRTFACGTALHHARIALAADGIGVETTLLPAGEGDLLAVVRYTGRIPRREQAERLRRAIAVRRTDRRSLAAEPVPDAAADLLRAAAEGEGARWHPLAGAAADGAEDPFARYAVIATAGDRPGDWLVAGEAVSAVLLHATAAGLTAATVRHPPAVPPAGGDHPAAVVRYGVAGRGTAATRTPPSPAADVIELVPRAREVPS